MASSIFRVLKPPGGGSSDIFGSGENQNPVRSVKDHQKSTIFDADKNDSPSRRVKPGDNSQDKLFGEADTVHHRRAVDHMKSSIFDESLPRESTVRQSKTKSINPITGEPLYPDIVNGDDNSSPNEEPAVAAKKRQPPGGLATKLW